MSFESQLEAIFDAGLLKDVHQVHFHRADRDRQRISDLFILHAAADQCYDLVLTWSKSRQVAAIEKADHLIGNRVLDPDITSADRPQTLHDRGDGKNDRGAQKKAHQCRPRAH